MSGFTGATVHPHQTDAAARGDCGIWGKLLVASLLSFHGNRCQFEQDCLVIPPEVSILSFFWSIHIRLLLFVFLRLVPPDIGAVITGITPSAQGRMMCHNSRLARVMNKSKHACCNGVSLARKSNYEAKKSCHSPAE